MRRGHGKRILAIVVLAVSSVSSVSYAEDAGPPSTTPVNATCPVSKEPVVPSGGTVQHGDHTIGLCCPGCGKAFLAWDTARRDAFVALALRGTDGAAATAAGQAPPTSRPASAKTIPYLLDICIVGGGKLGSMGEPVIKAYDGREVRFCCGGCIKTFEANQGLYWKKIDELVAIDQRRFYPATECVVTGEPLIEDGEDIAKEIVVHNRLVRVCCGGCARKIKAEPTRFIAKLDETVKREQGSAYPLKTCVVGGGALGSMGDVDEVVVAGRLVRLCCAGCRPKLQGDPARYLAKVDEAWKQRGRYLVQETGNAGDP